jgi:hypothetical protein
MCKDGSAKDRRDKLARCARSWFFWIAKKKKSPRTTWHGNIIRNRRVTVNSTAAANTGKVKVK